MKTTCNIILLGTLVVAVLAGGERAAAGDCNVKALSESIFEVAQEIKERAGSLKVEDKREVIDATAPGNEIFTGIARVTSELAPGHGSGFLIDKCHVLSVRHVVAAYEEVVDRNGRKFSREVFTERNDDPVYGPQGKKVKLEFAYDRNGRPSYVTTGGTITVGAYRNWNLEFAVIRIDNHKKLPDGLTELDLLNTGGQTAFKLRGVLAGFNGDKVDQARKVVLTGQRSCGVIAPGYSESANPKLRKVVLQDAGWETDCVGAPGVSGAPLIVDYPKKGGGTGRAVVGIAVGLSDRGSLACRADQSAELGAVNVIPMYNIIEKVERALAFDKCE